MKPRSGSGPKRTGSLRTMLAAGRLRRAFVRRERMPRAQFDAWRRERLAETVRHAATASPFWRERLADVDLSGDIELEALPTIDKPTFMAEWDRVVTVDGLRLADVEARIDGPLEGDDVMPGGYRAFATGGTTGVRGVFVYSAEEWIYQLGNFLRWNSMAGIVPRLPRLKVASIHTRSALHMSGRYGMSLDLGLYRVLRLDARDPLEELIAELERFQPDVLLGYPSALALLAHERPPIAPRIVVTTSEVRTPEMTAAIQDAWGREPFECYGITEAGLSAGDCAEHRGMHVFEDVVWVEPLERGGMLVTPLYTRTLPLIRYEITDLVRLDEEPCACGRTLVRFAAVEGRADDILPLRARGGETVEIHPIVLRSPLAHCSTVKQYRIVHDGRGLHVRVVPTGPAGDARDEVRSALQAALDDRGVAEPLEVVAVDALERDTGHSGKFKLIERA